MTADESAVGHRLVLPPQHKDAKEEGVANTAVLPVRGVIFDMDGTLTRPQTWMFGEMRRQLEVPKGVDILHHLASLATAEERHAAEAKLRAIEEKAMVEQEPTKGLQRTLAKLASLGIKTSICTRNVPKPVSDFCQKFLECDPFDMHEEGVDTASSPRLITGPVLTREFQPPKPSPKPLLHIIGSWNVPANQVVMVGDSLDDMDAGLAAGCAVVLLRHEDNEHVENSYVSGTDSRLDGVAHDLDDLYTLLGHGLSVKNR